LDKTDCDTLIKNVPQNMATTPSNFQLDDERVATECYTRIVMTEFSVSLIQFVLAALIPIYLEMMFITYLQK
jgi:hypothetical protein